MVVCSSRRLILRRFTHADLDALTRIHEDPAVLRFIGGAARWGEGGALERLSEYLADYDRVGFSKWAVVLRATGELIGRCGPVVETIEGHDELELGYTFGRRYWGAGYATEAAAAALEHCTRVLGRARVVSVIDPENTASLRVAERVGMKYERDIAWSGKPARLYAIVARGLP